MLTYKLGASIIAAVILLLQVALREKWHDKRTKVHRRTLVALSMSVSAALAVSLFTVVADDRSALELRRQLSEVSGNLQKASQDVATLARENRDLLTGGDSFCYISVGSLTGNDNVPLLLLSAGKNTLQDVQVSLRDLDNLHKLAKKGDSAPRQLLSELLRGTRIGDLPPHAAQIIGWLRLRSDQRSYFVQIEARNGTFIQPIRFRRVGGKWKVATEVSVIPPDGTPPDLTVKPVFKRVDQGFPLNNRGEVDWQVDN
jgi:hypothetical protein